jgi:pimeloyl-ACP methyl ester carboxylesterase
VGGETIVGNLFLPAEAKLGDRLPAVALFATWTSTKEMIVPNYAARLAPAGYAVLTIDFRGFGESDGAERRTESPARKVQDIHAAVDFLAKHPSVDSARLGLFGICAGSGYVAAEASTDPRVRSLVFVAPWFHDGAIAEAVYGGATGVAKKQRLGKEARRRFLETGVIDYVRMASNTDATAAMYSEGDALAYYLDVRRGGIPHWGNQFALMAWPDWLAFDMVAPATHLHQPTLLVHAESAAIPEGAHRFAARMPTKPKEVWLQGPTQFDFYDRPDIVARAASEALTHFNATLR